MGVALVSEVSVSHLLNRIKFPSPRKQDKTPLMVEFPVNPDTAPYLVSSSGGLLWVEESMKPTPEMWPREGAPDTIVRVAVRPDVSIGISGFFREVLAAVEAKALDLSWGSVQDYTEEGIEEAIAYVSHYDLGGLCLLYPPAYQVRDPTSTEPPPLPLKDIALRHNMLPQPCSWMPRHAAVVVPKDREFLGSIGFLGRKGVVIMVHNAARGIAIASRRPSPTGGRP